MNQELALQSESVDMHGDLESFFSPKRVALVGASDRSRWSWNTFDNLSSFETEIFCVNPRGGVVHGQTAFTDLDSLPVKPDLAYIMVPTTAVASVMKEVVDSGIRNAILLTSGYAETGKHGAALEREVIDIANAGNVRVLGPNCVGYINVHGRTSAYSLPLPGKVAAGGVSVVLQSGALANSVFTISRTRSIGLSHLVTMGNEAQLDLVDVVNYLIDDESTKSIALFVESFRDPARFVSVAKKALVAGKPIIAMKVGRTEIGARVALAHTGAVVGDDRLIDAVFTQFGVVRVDSIDDLMITAGLLAQTGPLPGPRAAFITSSGGASDIIADRSTPDGFDLPEFSTATEEALSAFLPSFASVMNPLDVTGSAVTDPMLLPRAVESVAKDPSTDFVVCLAEPPRAEPPNLEHAETNIAALANTRNNASVPVIFMGLTATDTTPYQQDFAKRFGFPEHLIGLDRALTAIEHAAWWSGRYHRERAYTPEAPLTVGVPQRKQGERWSEHVAAQYLRETGIPMVPSTLATTANEAVAAAEEYGYPVALKIVSPNITHKSDIGGVALNITSPDELTSAFASILGSARAADPSAELSGILVSPMRKLGIELLLGVVRDPRWGLTLAVGMGGVFVELLADVSMRVLPVSREDVREMLDQLRGSRILDGFRGAAPVDREQIIDVVVRLSEIALTLGDDLQSIELNPVNATSTIEALDAVIEWTDGAPG